MTSWEHRLAVWQLSYPVPKLLYTKKSCSFSPTWTNRWRIRSPASIWRNDWRSWSTSTRSSLWLHHIHHRWMMKPTLLSNTFSSFSRRRCEFSLPSPVGYYRIEIMRGHLEVSQTAVSKNWISHWCQKVWMCIISVIGLMKGLVVVDWEELRGHHHATIERTDRRSSSVRRGEPQSSRQ